MDRISSTQRSFIQLMKRGEDYELRGFELLLKRADFPDFFDVLAEEGLFDPSRNLGPVETDKPGQYRIPFWPPLAYLEAVAGVAGERADAALAEKAMKVVRSVSRWRDNDGKPRDNYITWHSFAKILGSLPSIAVSRADIDLASIWLTGRFGHSMAGHALASGALRKFLASNDPTDWAKACRALFHCTAVVFGNKSSGPETIGPEPQTVLDDYWLKELIHSTAADFGRKTGRDVAEIFRARATDVFASQFGGLSTSLLRPTIEEHEQNHEWRGPYNRFVEGLRDSILGWLEVDPDVARPYVDDLLDSRVEILERVAIYILTQRFDLMRGLTPKAVSPTMFDAAHRHEVYDFLSTHFQQLTEGEKAGVISVIRDLPTPDRGENSEHIRLNIQRTWLTSIQGKGYEPADSWISQLNNALGELTNFVPPNFTSYHETSWGFGSTPHEAQELIAFAQAGTVVDRLNDFTPSDDWNGPSKRSLSDAVIDAVSASPNVFLDLLPEFLRAKPEYQYAIIAGFKKLWDGWDGKPGGLPWDSFWPRLIDFFEAIFTSDQFWAGEVAEEQVPSPTRDWIPPVIAEFLEAGTRSDDKAYDPRLLPRTLPLLVTLLAKSEPQTEPRERDALNGAINTTRGKAIEALINHALRCCRLADKARNSHTEEWRELEEVFELAACPMP